MANEQTGPGKLGRMLDGIERVGNKLPDPAVLFLIGLAVTWGLSFWLSEMSFAEIDPRTDKPIEVVNLLSMDQFATFLASMVEEFVRFPPLGAVPQSLVIAGGIENLVRARLASAPNA